MRDRTLKVTSPTNGALLFPTLIRTKPIPPLDGPVLSKHPYPFMPVQSIPVPVKRVFTVPRLTDSLQVKLITTGPVVPVNKIQKVFPVNDLKLWLDASDTASIEMDSSNKVYKWHDKSGNGYDAFGSVNNQLPLYSSTGINSKPALSFDGSNDFLEANNRLGLPANPAITVIMVARVNQHAQADERFLEIGGGSHHLAVSTGSEGWSWRHNGGQERYGNTAVNTDYLLAWERPANGNYASSKFYLNGVEQAAYNWII